MPNHTVIPHQQHNHISDNGDGCAVQCFHQILQSVHQFPSVGHPVPSAAGCGTPFPNSGAAYWDEEHHTPSELWDAPGMRRQSDRSVPSVGNIFEFSSAPLISNNSCYCYSTPCFRLQVFLQKFLYFSSGYFSTAGDNTIRVSQPDPFKGGKTH